MLSNARQLQYCNAVEYLIKVWNKKKKILRHHTSIPESGPVQDADTSIRWAVVLVGDLILLLFAVPPTFVMVLPSDRPDLPLCRDDGLSSQTVFTRGGGGCNKAEATYITVTFTLLDVNTACKEGRVQ